MVDAEAFRGLTWGLPSSLPSTRPQAGGMEGVKGHRSRRSTGTVLLQFSRWRIRLLRLCGLNFFCFVFFPLILVC